MTGLYERIAWELRNAEITVDWIEPVHIRDPHWNERNKGLTMYSVSVFRDGRHFRFSVKADTKPDLTESIILAFQQITPYTCEIMQSLVKAKYSLFARLILGVESTTKDTMVRGIQNRVAKQEAAERKKTSRKQTVPADEDVQPKKSRRKKAVSTDDAPPQTVVSLTESTPAKRKRGRPKKAAS